MPRLFTYIIPYDDGAAPNPYGGICTLNICKPGIRRAANVGDWVAAFGSKNAPSGNLSGKLVYAMKVTSKLLMSEYDELARNNYPLKVPEITSPDPKKRLGDAIYDFRNATKVPIQRLGVHEPRNAKTDLSGRFCLLSNHYVYFGNKPVDCDIKEIIYQGRGHRSTLNDPHLDRFSQWIEALITQRSPTLGEPDYEIDWGKGCSPGCAIREPKIDLEEDTKAFI